MTRTKNRKFNHFVFFVTAVFVVGLFVVFAVSTGVELPSGTSDFGLYTFERNYVIANKEYSLYQSGEDSFNYYHDENGFILLLEEDGVYYAKNKNGRPVSSNILYGSDVRALKNVELMTRHEIDFTNNPDLLTDYSVDEAEQAASLFGITVNEPINNFVIYIAFKDDSQSTINTLKALAEQSNKHLNGDSNSLKDYFYTMSNGSVTVNSHFPTSQGAAYVYTDSNNRSYYNIKTPQSTRGKREASLLTSAVNAAKSKFQSLYGYNLDVNEDGYLDGVSFIVSGSSGSDWGNLLWPHSWNLTSINNAYNNGADASIDGVKVGSYTFSFATDFNVGLLCHEFNHVLGAPDLYHSNYDYVPVGHWDLMQYNQPTPQYSLTYMRDKYIGGIYDEQIEDINHSGVYSLKPVSTSSYNDVLAYKISTGKSDEYFMVEYRNPDVSSVYDSGLPGAGLIIYRIKVKSGLEGNINAKYRDKNNPDEVYIFRPKVATGGSNYESSRINIENAYLSPKNPSFSKVGIDIGQATDKYSNETLYYTDGTNSGIIIEALSISNQSIEFRVRLNSSYSIGNNYFEDKISIFDAKYVDNSYSGVEASLDLENNIELSYLGGINVYLLAENGEAIAKNSVNLGKFFAEYKKGVRNLTIPFVVSDKGGIVQSIFETGNFDFNTTPKTVKLEVIDADGDAITIESGFEIDQNGISWQQIKQSILNLNPSVVAGARITIGIKNDGTLTISGNGKTDGMFAIYDKTNITAAAAGLTHVVLLDKYQNVTAFGSNDFGELGINGLGGVVAVAAGLNSSYALLNDGTVRAFGKNSTEVAGWSDIVAISAANNTVVGITNEGKLVGAGGNEYGQLQFENATNIKSISLGNTFVAALTSGGTVSVFGSLNGDVRMWSDIKKIAAGGSFLYGLSESGKVLAVGNNSQGQCGTEGLVDIMSIAAGEYHGAFLRIDGVVEYRGSGNGTYYTNSPLENLIYDDYISATSLSINYDKETLLIGQKINLNSVITPQNATYKRIIYTSTNTNILSVDENGKVTALTAGTARIEARINGTEVTAFKDFNVSLNSVPTQISFISDLKTLILGGMGFSLSVLFTPLNSMYDLEYLSFYASNDVVSISASGYVTPNRSGETEIEAVYDDGISDVLRTVMTIKVVDGIESIEIYQNPSKIEYWYGEDFDLSGFIIKINIESGYFVYENVTRDMIGGFSPFAIGEQTISVGYLGKSVELSQKIIVNDYYTKLEIVSLPKIEYLYGQELSVDNGTIKLTKASGSADIRALRLSEVSGFNKNVIGLQRLTVTIVTIKVTLVTYYNITVIDTIKEIRSQIVKRSYNFNEPLNQNENFLIIKLSGAQDLVSLNLAEVFGFDNRKVGQQTITISYFDELSGLTHTVNDTISVGLGTFTLDISGKDGNGFLRYTNGGKLNTLSIVFENAFTRESVFEDGEHIWFSIEGFDPSLNENDNIIISIWIRNTAGANVLVGSFTEKAKKAQSFTYQINDENNGEYYFNEEIKITLTIFYDDGQSFTFIPKHTYYDVNLFDTYQDYVIYDLGEPIYTTIIINDYLLYILDVEMVDIAFGSQLVHEILAKTASGREVDIFERVSFEGFDNEVLGIQTVVVSAQGLSPVSFTVNVIDLVKTIEIDTPIKTQYLYGEQINTASLYAITTLSGVEDTIYFNTDEFEIVGFDPYTIGLQRVTIIFLPLDKRFDFDVTVSDYVVELSLGNLSKTTYFIGDELEITLKAEMASGAVLYPLIGEYTHNFDNRQQGEQGVRVEFMGFEMRFEVFVFDDAVKMEIKRASTIVSLPKGRAFAFDGLIEITYRSGTVRTVENEAVFTLEISYDPKIVGKQVVRICADSVFVEFEVEVLQMTIIAVSSDLLLDLDKGCIITREFVTTEDILGKITTTNYLSALTENGKILIVNEKNQIILSLDVYAIGDANLDGIFDQKDIDEMVNQFLREDYILGINDFDGDKSFSLTDIINNVRRLKEQNQNEANNLAKTFISDIKPKKEEGSDEKDD